VKNINGSDLGKAGVSAHFEGGKLVIKDSTGGSIDFTDETSDSKNVLDKLGLTSSPTGTPYARNVVTATGAANAKVKFNNVDAEFATNSFQLNGINFVAKETMGTEASITVNQDVDTVFENIKSFVTKYNEMVDLVNKELNEKRYRDFQPLTAEQREAMEEKDIERWEEKAKSGMLKGDLLLQSAANNLRSALNRTVQGLPSGDMKVLADIGITSGSWSENGKLYIDETKLRKAIAENPDQVAALFSTNDGVKGAQNTDGLAVRLYQEADAIMEKITKKAGKEFSVNNSFTLGKNLDDLEDEMEEWAVRLDSLQTRYYKQFTAMENALNKMNAQSSYLMQQFGGAG
jgi:flagellar hook-associated protein 2